MKESVQAQVCPLNHQLTGGDAVNWMLYQNRTLADSAVLGALNAMAVNESNAKMGLVCIHQLLGRLWLSTVLTAAIQLGLTESQQLGFLFTARLHLA